MTVKLNDDQNALKEIFVLTFFHTQKKLVKNRGVTNRSMHRLSVIILLNNSYQRFKFKVRILTFINAVTQHLELSSFIHVTRNINQIINPLNDGAERAKKSFCNG